MNSDVLSRCIAEIEARTRAEVVLSIQKASGEYRDVDLRFASMAGFAFIVYVLFTHHEIPPESIPLPLLGLYGLTVALIRYTPLRRWLTPRRRRDRQVRKAADALFHRLRIHQTQGRTGVLLYFSKLEQKALILADSGATPAFPEDTRREYENQLAHACRRDSELEQKLGGVLRTLGVHLERTLPPEEDETLRKNELPDHAFISTSTGEDEGEDEA